MSFLYHQTFKQGLFGKYKAVFDRLPSRGQILEIGCHTGYFSRFLMDKGYQVTAIESDYEAAEIAKANGVAVICDNVESFTSAMLAQQKFDVILLMDVLEHLRSPSSVLQNIKPLLHKNGRVLITGPNAVYWSVRREVLCGRWNYTDTGILDRTHLRFYTATTWRTLVEDSGYRVTALNSVDGIVPLVHYLGRIPYLHHLPAKLHDIGMKLMPNLFTVTYLLEAIGADVKSV